MENDLSKYAILILAANEFIKLNKEGTSVSKASTPEPVGIKPLWNKKSPTYHLPFY